MNDNDITARRETRRRELAKLTKDQVCRMYRTGVNTPDGRISRWIGGMFPPEKWTKNEVITAILDIEIPRPGAEQ